VNKLGEYMVATPSRRRQILRDQMRPQEVKVVRYKEAARAIAECLASPESGPEVLERHLARLRHWTPGADDSAFEIARVRDCCLAIEHFASLLPTLDLGGLILRRTGPDAEKLTKAGVRISVRPELVGSRAGKAGAVKLHLSRTFTLAGEAGAFVGTLLHEYGERHLSSDGPVSPRGFYVIDVFGKAVYPAPRSFARRRADVEAACEEIASRWATLERG
jgi:hypothetical protein